MRPAGGPPPKLLYGLLIAANIAAWLWAWRLFAGQPALLGTALLAWTLGLRHAVDADHIAAIDNAVRKLLRDGKPPIATGFWFSLGHSSVVIAATVAIACATEAMRARLAWLHAAGATIGTALSAGFLLLIALVNLVILREVWRGFRHAAGGGNIGQEPANGPLTRLCRPLFRAVTRPIHMFPVGFLFGLGFDTATEIGLLGIAATQTAKGMSGLDILVFPALFTAAMALVDTADSGLMTGAYGWAQVEPVRKIWYNLTITAASILVALLIGGVEALGLLADRFGLEGPVWSAIEAANNDLTLLGLAAILLFALSWALSAILYRRMGI